MYLLAILGVILAVILTGMFTEPGLASLSSCIDSVSLILILVIVIPVMASMEMLKDVNHAFKLTLGKRKAESLRELKRARLAITYLIRSSLFAGALGTLFGVVQLSSFCKDVESFLPGVGVAACSLLYAFVIAIVLLPIEARLEKKILEFMENEE